MERKIFFYKGKRYEMTDEQIEAAYYFRQRQNLYEDAYRQLLTFVFGDDPDDVSEVDKASAIVEFQRKYGLELQEVGIERIVSRYEKLADCNIPENTAWQSAVWDVVHKRKRF